ncbi:MAG: hypothetical protein ABIA63_08620 [bacterium]
MKTVILLSLCIISAVYGESKIKGEVLPPGGAICNTLLGSKKIWFYIAPKYQIRNLTGQNHTLDLQASFPYTYALSAGLKAPQDSTRPLGKGLYVRTESFPYFYAPYYMNRGRAAAYVTLPALFGWRLKLTVRDELAVTWLIDTTQWKALDQQALVSDLNSISEHPLYPRKEHAPSLTLSGYMDTRDNALNPGRGFFWSMAIGHHRVYELVTGYRYWYNQFGSTVRVYARPGKRHVLAMQYKSVIRDRFDAVNLSHRLIYHDDDAHFRGFYLLCGENMKYTNMEYRFRLFPISKGAHTWPPFNRSKLINRFLKHSIELFTFVDNGLFWGTTYAGKWEDIRITWRNFGDHLYTSAGGGIRAVLPALNWVASAGVIPYHRKIGLHEDYKLYYYVSHNIYF